MADGERRRVQRIGRLPTPRQRVFRDENWMEIDFRRNAPAQPKTFFSWMELCSHGGGAVEMAFDNEDGHIIVEGIAAKICCGVIDIDHEVLGGQ